MTRDDTVKELMDLFLTFARVGLFTFGGGYAMLPMLQNEVVEKKGWATHEEMLDYYAIGQCTPGVIAVNTATFIGFKRRGIIGGVFATAGVVFPSLVIISGITAFLKSISDFEAVTHAFSAIRVAVGVLILNSVIKISRLTMKNKLCAITALLAFLSAVVLSASPVIIVLAASLTGLFLPLLKPEKGKEGK